MSDNDEEFGRETVVSLARFLEGMGHANLDRFVLANELEDSRAEAGTSLSDKANRIIRFLITNPGVSNARGASLRSQVVRAAVRKIAPLLTEGAHGTLDSKSEPYQALLSALSEDGYSVEDGHLKPKASVANNLDMPAPDNDLHPNKPDTIVSKLSVFISHSSRDTEFVRMLISLLRSALNLPAEQIRCTSIDGYRLPAGASASESLRREIHEAEAFIGVISKTSLQSLYVLFELGARWGAQKHLIPLLGPGVDHTVLTGPLADLNAVQAAEPAQLHALVTDLAKQLRIPTSSPAAYHEQVLALQQLSVAAGVDASSPATVKEEQGNPILKALTKEARHLLERAVTNSDPAILRVRSMSGTSILVNGDDLTENLDRRGVARWESAVDELSRHRLIRDLGHKGEVYELTSAGWELGDLSTEDTAKQ